MQKLNDMTKEGKLWSVSVQLHGLGEIIELTQTELSEKGRQGIGHVLRLLGEWVDKIRDENDK